MRTSTTTPPRAFSLVELLIALTITATLLTATLAALDTGFRSYKVTTEGASTHVVARMVMHRLMAMVRNGTEFGPYPADVLDRTLNPMTSSYIEFTSLDDQSTGHKQIIRIERRATADAQRGPFELWYMQFDYTRGALTAQDERPLITGLREAAFTLQYDVGPRLRKATVDLTIKPNDLQDAAIHSDLETPTIRLVSSVAPRRLD